MLEIFSFYFDFSEENRQEKELFKQIIQVFKIDNPFTHNLDVLFILNKID